MVLALTSGVASAAGSQTARNAPDCSVMFVAHRGGRVEGYPENTLAAYRRAIDDGADALEIDLRGTKDGKIVVMHDATVDRTTNGWGAVAQSTLADLKKLDAGKGERIPTYEEVLQLAASTGVILVLDIKESPSLDKRKVVRLTEQRGAVPHVIVGLRNLKDLRTIRTLNPKLRTLGFIDEVDDAQSFVKAGVDIIRLWPEWIDADPGLIAAMHRLGKPVWATTGDAPRKELLRLIALGVEGVISDLPKLKRNCTPKKP